MKALLVSNGDIKDSNLLRKMEERVDFILAADGGANHCIGFGIMPDLIIGDLDSIESKILDEVKKNDIETIKYPSKKNATDTEICLDYLVDNGYEEIFLLGSIGSRLDHSLANIYLLEYLFRKGVRGYILNEKNIISLLEGELIVEKYRKYISILGISDSGIVVSLDGLEYPLDHKKIERGSTLGISNEFKSRSCKINIHEGRALVIQSDD